MAMKTIDFTLLTSDDVQERLKTATELLNSFESCGFVRIVKHRITASTVSDLFELSKAFFRLPAEEKNRIANPPGPNPQRGWSKVGAENSASLYRKGLLKEETIAKSSDAREHWDQGSKNDVDFPNRWPKEHLLPKFRERMENAFEEMENICRDVMTALEVAYQLPKGAFLERITREKNASEFRFNHYPVISIEELKSGSIGRIWPHYDLGVITLLFQDSVGGLEMEDRQQKNRFNAVECLSTPDLIVNVSETLTRWTNGQLAAGLHKVSVPPGLKERDEGVVPERYSIAYFCKADRDSSVGPLPHFTKEISLYEDITAMQYHQQRLLSAY